METTTASANTNYSVFCKSEPVLSRKALLEVLGDRAETTEFVSIKPYTFVAVRTWYDSREYIGYGFSKVCWPDKWDAEQGAEIAHRRALISVLHQVRLNEMRDKLPF